MARSERVVAELGRPETPDETAERKARFSAAYRSSQTTRNLVAALLVTLGLVLVIVLAVPRGSVPERQAVDVAAVAERVSTAEDRLILVPDVPASWRVNTAAIEGDDDAAWTIVYVPGEKAGFLRVAQGFDADEGWPSRVLRGAEASETKTIDGIEWTVYDIRDPARAGNVSIALSTQAGPDTVLIYGSTDEKTAETAARSVAQQVQELRQEAR
jgi:hypothetical protein